MINVEIKMVSGETFRVQNAISDNLKEFIKNVFAPYGTTMVYVEIYRGQMIMTDNIESIREITLEEAEEEVEEIKEDEFVEIVDEDEIEVEDSVDKLSDVVEEIKKTEESNK